MKTIRKKLNNGKFISQAVDMRGKHHNRPQKVSDFLLNAVREHIRSFPTVESHYVRKDSERQYLEEGFSIAKIYTACMKQK